MYVGWCTGLYTDAHRTRTRTDAYTYNICIVVNAHVCVCECVSDTHIIWRMKSSTCCFHWAYIYRRIGSSEVYIAEVGLLCLRDYRFLVAYRVSRWARVCRFILLGLVGFIGYRVYCIVYGCYK